MRNGMEEQRCAAPANGAIGHGDSFSETQAWRQFAIFCWRVQFDQGKWYILQMSQDDLAGIRSHFRYKHT